jgi:hypothetical protein
MLVEHFIYAEYFSFLVLICTYFEEIFHKAFQISVICYRSGAKVISINALSNAVACALNFLTETNYHIKGMANP